MIQNKMFELVFQGEKPDGSETLADIKAVFTNGNSSQSVKGFYDGNGTYKVRFLPREAGVYSWKVTGAVEAEEQEECTASTQHGMVHTQGYFCLRKRRLLHSFWDYRICTDPSG